MTTAAAPDPEWMSRPERGATIVIKTFVWIALHLGRRAVRPLLYPICLYFLVFSTASRRASSDYLTRALGRKPGFVDQFRHYHAFAACLLDRIFLLNNQIGLLDIRAEGEDFADEILASGRGCLLVGAHLGSFEVLSALGARRSDLRVSLVMYEENARKINTALNAINPAHKIEIISLGQFDSILRIETKLAQGEFVGMLADRGLDGERQMRVPFLGADAAFPLGPFRIAAMLKCPIILMVALYRGGGRYDVHFDRLMDPATDVAADHPLLVETAIRLYVEKLEHYCRSAPYNWFNFYDFWK